MCIYDHRICVYMCEFVQAIYFFWIVDYRKRNICYETHHLHNARKKEFGLLCVYIRNVLCADEGKFVLIAFLMRTPTGEKEVS